MLLTAMAQTCFYLPQSLKTQPAPRALPPAVLPYCPPAPPSVANRLADGATLADLRRLLPLERVALSSVLQCKLPCRCHRLRHVDGTVRMADFEVRKAGSEYQLRHRRGRRYVPAVDRLFGRVSAEAIAYAGAVELAEQERQLFAAELDLAASADALAVYEFDIVRWRQGRGCRGDDGEGFAH